MDVQLAAAALLWDVPKCHEKDCVDLIGAEKAPRLAVEVSAWVRITCSVELSRFSFG